MEHVGKIPCSPLEEVWVSLGEVQGKPQLELQLRSASAPDSSTLLPQHEGILLPVDQLPSLLRLLARAREVCISRGLLSDPDLASIVTMEQGESIVLPLQRRAIVARRDLRIPLRLPVECRLVDPEGMRPAKPVSGEVRDISLRGAQVWLPQRLPRFKQVDVGVLLDGRGFLARATIVNVELESNRDPTTGYHRHGLKWVAMEPTPREILTAAIAKRSEGGGAPTPPRHTATARDAGPPAPREDRNPPAEPESAVDEEESSAGHSGRTLETPLPEFLERRRAPRVALPEPVPVRARAQGPLEVRLLDLSLIGGRIEHPGSLQPGSACVLEFPAASSPLALSARVIHSSPLGGTERPGDTRPLRHETGLTFVDITPEQQAVLRRIVEWLALGGTANGILTVS
ncbi:MAG TPA: PilZ domain-containing protein [Candidatus Methylomirabilis sp.]|nr:PilZ domain-containing protein [Candidatus Methylomirabilis sp.]